MPYYPVLFACAVTAAVICHSLFFFNKPSRMQQRLHAPVRWEPVLVQTDDTTRILPSDLVKKVEEKLGLARDSAKSQEMKKTLVQAGFNGEGASSVYMGIKVGLALGLPMLSLPFLLRLHLNAVFLCIALYLLILFGYLIPTLFLGHLVAKRKTKIRDSLPDALELLVVCVEAGQGLNAAIKRVGDDLKFNHPILAQELLKVNLEMNAGLERGQALRNLGERTGVEEVISLCNILIQSDRFGTGIATTLKVQSDAVRTARRQKLETLAAKTPVKLVFPLLLFIFPAIMVVILGPAAIRISQTLLK